MELSEYVGGLRRELASITRFAGEEVTRTAEMLADALDSSVRLTLLEVVSAAAAEISAHLDDTVIDVRLSGGQPEFVVSTERHEPEADAGATPGFTDAEDAGTARVTLRLSESLKSRIESEAMSAGLSVNSWLVRAATWALEDSGGRGPRGPRPPRPPRPPRIGQRLTGYARS